ncbi:MAG: hypothetical protein F9B45_13180 [Phycisphaera sp. RhM]|nr:hypothetical protein [Phycisphaera sp. RhM]
MAIIGRTRDQIGRGRALTREELFLEVITPLRNMLDTGITGVDYTKLAGHASDGRVFCNTLLVAFCDEIDPSQFEANYQTLVACEGMLGGWLDPSLAG